MSARVDGVPANPLILRVDTSRVIANVIRPSVVAGIAVAGASLWLATMADAPDAAPEVRLASVESVLSTVPLSPATATCGELWCSGLFGSAVSAPTPTRLVAAAGPDP